MSPFIPLAFLACTPSPSTSSPATESCPDEPGEPNDTFALAATLQPVQEGTLRNGDDEDVYLLDIPPAQDIVVQLVPAPDPDAAIDLDLAIFDEDHALLAASTANAGALEELTYTNPTNDAQVAYLRVQRAPSSATTCASYTLEIVEQVCVDDFNGRNDGWESAPEIVEDGTYTAVMDPTIGQDFFVAAVLPGDTLTATLETVSSLHDIDLFLYHLNGDDPLSASQGAGDTESVSWTNDHTYLTAYVYVVAASYGLDNACVLYDLTVERYATP